MIPIFIGYDRKESVAYHVLAHSILSRATVPVQLIPLNRKNLDGHYWRARGEHDSTDFSNSRWIIPHLCGFKGWAIFMDCDMVCRADINELWEQRDDDYAVMVKKHNYEPKETTKFLGAEQTSYSRKNWSSLMLFNNEKCAPLTKHIVNTMTPGLWFHQFRWVADEDIGAIDGSWNVLAGYDDYNPHAKLIHYTSGGIWHDCHNAYDAEWSQEFEDMENGDNPIKWRSNG